MLPYFFLFYVRYARIVNVNVMRAISRDPKRAHKGGHYLPRRDIQPDATLVNKIFKWVEHYLQKERSKARRGEEPNKQVIGWLNMLIASRVMILQDLAWILAQEDEISKVFENLKIVKTHPAFKRKAGFYRFVEQMKRHKDSKEVKVIFFLGFML